MEEIKRIIGEIEADLVKFEQKGNKAAGTRVRTNLMKLSKQARVFRAEVLEQAQSMTTNA